MGLHFFPLLNIRMVFSGRKLQRVFVRAGVTHPQFVFLVMGYHLELSHSHFAGAVVDTVTSPVTGAVYRLGGGCKQPPRADCILPQGQHFTKSYLPEQP